MSIFKVLKSFFLERRKNKLKLGRFLNPQWAPFVPLQGAPTPPPVPAKFVSATKGTVQRVLLRMDWRESGNLEPDWRIDFFLSKKKKKKQRKEIHSVLLSFYLQLRSKSGQVLIRRLAFFSAQFFLMSICNLKIKIKKNPQHPTY